MNYFLAKFETYLLFIKIITTKFEYLFSFLTITVGILLSLLLCHCYHYYL